MTILIALVVLLAAFWAFSRFALAGPDLSAFDTPQPQPFGGRTEASPEHADVVEKVRVLNEGADDPMSRSERVRRMREGLEKAFGDREVDAEIREVDANGVRCEWVLAEGADPNRRLLYLHGGAFMAGSPKSHRPLTERLSRDNGAAVLSVDYRMMPEHRRMDCPTDCATAYQWILENGPAGPGAPDALFVAGDSAGGNLTLVTIAEARDRGWRAADAAVAFAPVTDCTYSSPSMKTNVRSDIILGRLFGQLMRVPETLRHWGNFLMIRAWPTDPRISPVFGDLGGLPPVLVQASTAEVLVDDGIRWVNKARAAGSDATIQVWPGMAHVFHAFEPALPEANEALDEVRSFLNQHAPRAAEAAAS